MDSQGTRTAVTGVVSQEEEKRNKTETESSKRKTAVLGFAKTSNRNNTSSISFLQVP
jgi:hypothetical protein